MYMVIFIAIPLVTAANGAASVEPKKTQKPKYCYKDCTKTFRKKKHLAQHMTEMSHDLPPAHAGPETPNSTKPNGSSNLPIEMLCTSNTETDSTQTGT